MPTKCWLKSMLDYLTGSSCMACLKDCSSIFHANCFHATHTELSVDVSEGKPLTHKDHAHLVPTPGKRGITILLSRCRYGMTNCRSSIG